MGGGGIVDHLQKEEISSSEKPSDAARTWWAVFTVIKRGAKVGGKERLKGLSHEIDFKNFD